jgi:hypothetical protein
MYVPGGEWTVGIPLPVIIELHNNGPDEISFSYEQHEWCGTVAGVPKRGFFFRRLPPTPRYAEVMIWYQDLPIVWPPPNERHIVQGSRATEPREVVIPAGKEYLFKASLSSDALLKGENQIQCSVSMVGEPIVCSEVIRIHCNPEPESPASAPKRQ